MRETKPEFVFFQMDVYWVSYAGQDPVKLLQKYPNRWVTLHIKDMLKGLATGVHTGGTPPTAKGHGRAGTNRLSGGTARGAENRRAALFPRRRNADAAAVHTRQFQVPQGTEAVTTSAVSRAGSSVLHAQLLEAGRFAARWRRLLAQG